MCCNMEPADDSCTMLKESELFEGFRYLTFPEVYIEFGTPCEKMLPVNDDEWFFEVNELRQKKIISTL